MRLSNDPDHQIVSLYKRKREIANTKGTNSANNKCKINAGLVTNDHVDTDERTNSTRCDKSSTEPTGGRGTGSNSVGGRRANGRSERMSYLGGNMTQTLMTTALI